MNNKGTIQMKMMMLAACALVATAAFAKVQEKDSVKKDASNPAVQEVLEEPDGVCLVRADDGTLQIYARGSAEYEFGDRRDIRTKTKVAELRAKAALAKYLKEAVSIEESETEGESQLSKALLTKSAEGSIKKKIVEREVVAAVKEIITVRSSAILAGVATLKTVKIPGEDGTSSGEIQVTLGVSTKTLASAAEAHNMITDSFNSRRTVGEKTNKSNDASADTRKVNSEEINKNKPEVRINKTLF
jgi:hypothetical protein